MCGRAANGLTVDEYQQAVRDLLERDLDVDPEIQGDDAGDAQEDAPAPSSSGRSDYSRAHGRSHPYRPTYNVAPQTFNPVVRNAAPLEKEHAGDKKAAHGARLQMMKWGLIPGYAKSLPTGADAYRTINARDDTALSGQSMWTKLLPQQRCVFFVQGFYEWQKQRDGSRLAHFVGMRKEGRGRVDSKGTSRQLMPLAGLWEKTHLTEPHEEDIYSFTILTTESNKQLGFLHDRMPVILPDAHAISVWLGLDPAQKGFTDEVARLVKPFGGQLDCYKCPTEVGKVGNSSRDFILPVSERKDGIMAAFGKARQKEDKKKEKIELHATDEGKRNGRPGDDVSTSTETNAPLPSASAPKRKAEAEVEEEPPSKKAETSEPSSRFSPDPYNPPRSPPRPRGGYSREDESPASPEAKAAQKGSRSIESSFASAKAASPAKPKAAPSAAPKASAKKSAGSSPKSAASSKGGADIRSFFGKAKKD